MIRQRPIPSNTPAHHSNDMVCIFRQIELSLATYDLCLGLWNGGVVPAQCASLILL